MEKDYNSYVSIRGIMGYWTTKKGYVSGLEFIYDNFDIKGKVCGKIDGKLKYSYFLLEKDEHINKILGKSGCIFDRITFYTTKNRAFTVGESDGGGSFMIRPDINKVNIKSIDSGLKSFEGFDYINEINVIFEDNSKKSFKV